MLFLLLAADLTLANFFSEGWRDEWQQRPRETRSMSLLRVTSNSLKRQARLDYVFTGASRDSHFADALVAYAVSRRLMVEVIASYQWLRSPPANGSAAGALLRVQLVETQTASYAMQVKLSSANKGVGQTQASFAYSLGGWHALAPGLGLYFSATAESLLGDHKPGARENDVQYAMALAQSFSTVTLFMEGAGTTDLDGVNKWTAALSVTPGVRWWFAAHQSITAGFDVPVVHAPFSWAGRAAYILNL